MRSSSLGVPAATPAARALFLYSSVGGGHLHATRALAAAWRAENPGANVESIDFLRFLPAWERRFWPGLYHLSLRYCPSLWRSYRRWTNRASEPRLVRNHVARAGVAAFAALARQARPRLVVSTIGGAAAIAGAARAALERAELEKPRGKRAAGAFLNALVLSDFRAHHHWARREADLIFVASEAAKRDLVAHRIPAARVFVSGIPVAPSLRPLDRGERARLRARLGLRQGPVLLVSSGATGAYRVHGRLLALLARQSGACDVVTFKGPAAPGFEEIGATRIFRLGFRDDFCDWLAASDLVVGKLGGHTAAEAFAAGVPVVVHEPIAGQEEENAAWAVEQGAALWPRDEAALGRTLTALLSEGGRLTLERMAHAARRAGRPDAGPTIVRVLTDALSARWADASADTLEENRP